jgi:hypothetical protein
VDDGDLPADEADGGQVRAAELRSAPAWLRGAFEGYCVLICGVLLGLYFFASA